MNKKFHTAMLVPIALLVIGGGLSGRILERQEPITVEEGYEEINLEYVERGECKSFYNITTDTSTKNATAVTYVDGKNNTLEFQVISLAITGTSREQEIYLELRAKGDFKEKYNLENFLFKMQELNGKTPSRNGQNFLKSYLRGENLKEWPAEQSNEGSRGSNQAFLGFDVKENDFSSEVRVTWDIPKSNWNNTYTLRLQSVVKGMSEDVTATVDVNIKEEVRA